MTDIIEDRVNQQFFTAKDGPVPTQAQKDAVDALTQAVRELAAAILKYVPQSRHQSIALTELEDLQMRANRGVFAP